MKSQNWGTVICNECCTRVSIDDAESSYNAELDDVVFYCSKCINDPAYLPAVSDDDYEAVEHNVQRTGLESPAKCTTEKLCPVHNRWHAAYPPRR